LSTCGRKLDAFIDIDRKLSECYAEVKNLVSEMKDLQRDNVTCDVTLLSYQDEIVRIKQELLKSIESQTGAEHALSTKDGQLTSMAEAISTCTMNLNTQLRENEVLEEKNWNCSITTAKLESEIMKNLENNEIEDVKKDLLVCQNNLGTVQKDNATCSTRLSSCRDNGLDLMINDTYSKSNRPSHWQTKSSRELQHIVHQKDTKAIVAGVAAAFIAPHLSSLLGVLFSPSVALVANPATLKAAKKHVEIKKLAANIAWKTSNFFAQTWTGGVH